MDFSKNKVNIIAIVALIVVCGGSFLGVRAMSNKVDTQTTVPSVYQVATVDPTTTEPTTTAAPTTTEPTTTVAPSTTISDLDATLKIESVITTFPISSTAPTTTKPTTTEPTTKETTTAPTTTAPVTTTEKTTVPKIENNKNTTVKNESNAMFDEGLAGYQYNTNGNFYYTSSDPWQRQFGYNELFDVGAGFVAIYMDTMRCKFEYKGVDWMIQFWKGQYGLVFVGHEIGVYTKPKDRGSDHYDAASNEDALYMELTGYRDGKELYHRDYGKYWWCTGFVPGTLDNFSDRSELSLKCRITMKDYDMLKGFTESLKGNGLVLGTDYAVDGLDVLITW